MESGKKAEKIRAMNILEFGFARNITVFARYKSICFGKEKPGIKYNMIIPLITRPDQSEIAV